MTKIFSKESRLDVVLRQGTYAIMREILGLSQRTINNQYTLNMKTGGTEQAFCMFDEEY